MTAGPSYYLSPATLFLGDTTPNSALLFSPLLMAFPLPEPSYPNYSLPRAQMVFDAYPGAGSQTNLTTLGSRFRPIIVPTGVSPTNDGLDNSLCAALSANTSTGYVADPANMLVNATTQWMSVGGVEGFRTMWVVGGLAPETNYTAWLVDDQGGVTQPMWFSTKEGELCRSSSSPETNARFLPVPACVAQFAMPRYRLRRASGGEHDQLAQLKYTFPAPNHPRRHRLTDHHLARPLLHVFAVVCLRPGPILPRVQLRRLLQRIPRLDLSDHRPAMRLRRRRQGTYRAANGRPHIGQSTRVGHYAAVRLY